MAHLADAEIVAADRLRRVIAEDNQTLIAYDQDAWASNLNYARRKISEALEAFRRIRAENCELLKGLPEQTFERTGTHTRCLRYPAEGSTTSNPSCPPSTATATLIGNG